jgi:hypothetical protein
MKKIVVAFVSFVISFSVFFAWARYEPSKTFNLIEALAYINALSTAYLDNAGNRESGGNFAPTDEYFRELKSRLDDLEFLLKQSQDQTYIKVTNVNTPENKIILQNALNCTQCKGLWDAAIAKTQPENTQQLKQILIVRTEMLEKMIPKNGPILKDAIIQIDLQMTYLRIIVVAYISS